MTVAPGSNPIVAVGKVRFGNAQPLALIAGPCALESRDHAFEMASALKEITARIGIGFVYKTSFDKANRTSARSNRGIGLEAALPIFADIRQKIGVPILTDVHDVQQCARGRSRGRAANPRLPLPADRSDRRRRHDRPRDQRQEGPVPGPLGYGERRRQGDRRRQSQRAGDRAWRLVRLQHARLGHARAPISPARPARR